MESIRRGGWDKKNLKFSFERVEMKFVRKPNKDLKKKSMKKKKKKTQTNNQIKIILTSETCNFIPPTNQLRSHVPDDTQPKK